VIIVAVSPITEDLFSVEHKATGSRLRLWNINGEEITTQTVICPEKVTSAVFTSGIEGVVQNVVITALETGSIKLWSTWDLSFVAVINTPHTSPITALAISDDSTQFISGDGNGLLVCSSCKKPRENYMSIGIKFS